MERFLETGEEGRAGDNGYGELGFQIRSLLRDSRLGKPSFADTALHLNSSMLPSESDFCKVVPENLFLKFVCWIPHLLEPRVAAKVAEFE